MDLTNTKLVNDNRDYYKENRVILNSINDIFLFFNNFLYNSIKCFYILANKEEINWK